MTNSNSQPSFPWIGSREGLSNEVLPPWTPLEISREPLGPTSVRCWGREYVFSKSPFPKAVTSAGAQLLSRPMAICAFTDNGPVQWENATLHVGQAEPGKAVLKCTLQGAGLCVVATTAIEYDGMVRVDWVLRARRKLTLERLSFKVPLCAAHARYIYQFPGGSSQTRNAAALSAEAVAMPFRPFVWLGDEARGLAWFCESDQQWHLNDPAQAIHITRHSHEVALTLTLVDRPTCMTPADEGLAYIFGLQATPVKPNTETVWEWRICHGGDYGIERVEHDAPAWLRYPAQGNFELLKGTLELFVQPLFDPQCPLRDINLFSVQCPKGDEIRWYFTAGRPHMRLVINQQQHRIVDLVVQPKWTAGRFSHMALTWGDSIRLFQDGELLDCAPRHGTLVGNVEGAVIVFGGPGAHLLLDEIRISDIARSEAEIAEAASSAHPLPVDSHVLLLDHLDEAFEPGIIEHLDGGYRGYSSTRPARAAGDWGWNGNPGGVVGLGRFTKGKWGNALELGLDRPPLDYLAEMGVKTLCLHEQWTDLEGYYSTTHGDKLRALVQACHNRGIRVLVYFGFLISDLAPEWTAFGDEIVAKPIRVYDPYDYPPQPHQRAYWVCYQSIYQDALAHGIARLMDEFDVDGVYLDGTATPPACANELHGCGYERADGTRVATYPIFATRRLMQRIYTIVKKRKPNGLVNVHQSTCMTIPTLAWATSLWDGEQFAAIEPGPFALEIIPLGAFRAEFMGHQWGLPSEFLCYDRPYTYEQALSFTLLHDVLVRPNGLGPHLELASRLWEIAAQFGRRDAKWLPYWSNTEYVTVEPLGALASLYLHPRRRTLVIVSNLTRNTAQVLVRLNTSLLGLSPAASAFDAITGEGLTLEEGAFRVRLDCLEWKIVWVEGNGSPK